MKYFRFAAFCVAFVFCFFVAFVFCVAFVLFCFVFFYCLLFCFVLSFTLAAGRRERFKVYEAFLIENSKSTMTIKRIHRTIFELKSLLMSFTLSLRWLTIERKAKYDKMEPSI